jgi:hypothetical protein
MTMPPPEPEPPPSSTPSSPDPVAPPEPPFSMAVVLHSARATALSAVAVSLMVAALGGAVGWLWAALSPRLQVIKSDKGFLYADPEPEQPVAADGIFLFLGLGLGIALAILVWVLLRRYRGFGMLIALSVGSLACSVFAYWVGHKIGVSQFNAVRSSAPVGAHLNAPVTLHITDVDIGGFRWWFPSGVVAGQALAAAFTYTGLAGFSAYDDLGRHRSRREIGSDAPDELDAPADAPDGAHGTDRPDGPRGPDRPERPETSGRPEAPEDPHN